MQYYVPAYLLNGLPRPLITTGPCTLSYNTQFGVTYYIPSPGGAIAQCVAQHQVLTCDAYCEPGACKI